MSEEELAEYRAMNSRLVADEAAERRARSEFAKEISRNR
jgi:hypothetical protein